MLLRLAISLLMMSCLNAGCPEEPSRAHTHDVRGGRSVTDLRAFNSTRVELSRSVDDAVKLTRPAKVAKSDARPRLALVEHSGRLDGAFEYLVVEPAHAPPETPLVLALHGRGDRPEAFSRLAHRLDLPVRTIVVRGPQRWGMRDGRAWFHLANPDAKVQISQQVKRLVTLVAQLRERYPGAPKPVVYGFSQGAMLALQAVAEHPELFGGVVALSGFLVLPSRGRQVSEPVPLLLTAGTEDRIIPLDKTKGSMAELAALGHKPEFLSFQGAHSIPKKALGALRDAVASWSGLNEGQLMDR